MSWLKELFGPSREAIWQLLAEELRGRFIPGGWLQQPALQVDYGQWTVTLDTYAVSTGKSHHTFTRMRAPFHNPEGFRMTVYRQGMLAELGKFLGMQDIEVRFPIFDHNFVIQSNQPPQVQLFFANARLRELLLLQPDVHFEIKDDEGLFGPRFGADVDELYFQASGEIKDPGLLRGLFELFGEALHTLCHLSPAYRDDVNLHIRTLLSSGGQITAGGALLWDANVPRWTSAEALGETADARSVRALIAVLDDDDQLTVQKSLDSLASVVARLKAGGAPAEAYAAAAPAAIRLLARGRSPGSRHQGIFRSAEAALGGMGAQPAVAALQTALRADASAVERLAEDQRSALKEALVEIVAGAMPSEALAASAALAELGHVPALPALRQLAARNLFDGTARRTVHGHIRILEGKASLPLAVEIDSGVDLPRIHEGPETAAGG